MRRNGGITIAPEGSCGCTHCAMTDMLTLSKSDFKYYCTQGNALYGQMCSGDNCKHGITNKDWPLEKAVGTKIQAYWCKFVSADLCKTFFCVECGQKRMHEEKEKMNNNTTTTYSKRSSQRNNKH